MSGIVTLEHRIDVTPLTDAELVAGITNAILPDKSRLYVWNGNADRLPEVRLRILNQRRVCEMKLDPADEALNMHNNPRAVDVRYLTDDPEAWRAAREDDSA